MRRSQSLAYMLMQSCDRGSYSRTLFLVILLFRAEGFRELKLSDANRSDERSRVMHVRFDVYMAVVFDVTALGAQ